MKEKAARLHKSLTVGALLLLTPSIKSIHRHKHTHDREKDRHTYQFISVHVAPLATLDALNMT